MRDGAGAQPHGLQPVLLQGEVQRRRACAPIGIHRAHHRTGIHHLLHVGGDLAQLVRVRAGDAVGDRKWRIRAEHQLGDTHARLGSQALGNRLAQPLFQRLALVLIVGTHHDLGE
ncbi:hypothetical protein D3C84_846690 [compost metagenome]